MTAENFYNNILCPIFEDKLKWYFFDKFNATPVVSYNKRLKFGVVNLEEDNCSVTFLTFNFFDSRLNSISFDGDIKYMDYKVCALPHNFFDVSEYSFPVNIEDLKPVYSLELSKCNTDKEFIKDFTSFFLSSLELEDNFIEYEKQIKKRRDETEGSIIF